ncbi:MAG: AAA family ATPase, partial [Prevotellaceae bacterium]|nr:AAA family ATPase [Prevotellaceae bacterium]
MATMKNLPIGIQSFEKLRERNYLYVDKTKEIYDLIAAGDIYFLSRP